MTDGEKAAAVIFFVVGFFLGGLGGLSLGHDLTIKELMLEKNHYIPESTQIGDTHNAN